MGSALADQVRTKFTMLQLAGVPMEQCLEKAVAAGVCASVDVAEVDCGGAKATSKKKSSMKSRGSRDEEDQGDHLIVSLKITLTWAKGSWSQIVYRNVKCRTCKHYDSTPDPVTKALEGRDEACWWGFPPMADGKTQSLHCGYCCRMHNSTVKTRGVSLTAWEKELASE